MKRRDKSNMQGGPLQLPFGYGSCEPPPPGQPQLPFDFGSEPPPGQPQLPFGYGSEPPPPWQPQLPFGYSSSEPPPPGQRQPQFHLFPSNFSPNAFVHSPNDLFHLQNPNIFFPNALPFHAHSIPFQNPNFHGQNTGFQPQQNPSFHPPQVPSVQGQNSGFHSQEHASNQNFGDSLSRPNFGVTLERASEEVVKARREIIAGGNNVSAWKVSQSVLLALRSESWESLGFQMQEIPPLHSLLVTERKINSFIQCFIGVRSITTLYELELAICENEGVEHFEELDLGPFLRHPLVLHYFSLSSDVKEVFKVTSENILSSIHKFLNNHEYNEAKIDELLSSIIEKSLTSREKLNVRIQSLGKHITCIRKALQAENVTLNKYVDGLKQKFGLKVRKHPLLSSEKRKLDDRFKDLSQRVESFASASMQFCGRHTRFSASLDDDDSTDYEDNKPANNYQSNSKTSHNYEPLDIVSNCPYPSAVEEIARLTSHPETVSKKKTSHPENDHTDGSTDDSDTDITDYEDNKTGFNSKLPERVSNCPYPSATEERIRLHFKPEKHTCGGTGNDEGYSTDYEDIKRGCNSQSNCKTSQSAKKLDQVSNSCRKRTDTGSFIGRSYHSAAKETTQLGLKPEKCYSHGSTGANRQDKMNSDLQIRKRKFGKRIGGSTFVPLRIPGRQQGETKVYTAEEFEEPFNEDTNQEYVAEIEMVSSWNYEKGQEHSSRVLYSSRATENSIHQSNNAAGNMVIPNTYTMFDSINLGMASSIPGVDLVVDSVNLVTAYDGLNYDSSSCSVRMKQKFPVIEQAVLTGRLGEFVAFKYFAERVGEENVNWVNEKNETGLPYDIIIRGEEGSHEYVEVKATNSSSKNWFNISSREWQFAAEKGESFSVAHVVLLGNDTTKVTIYKNLTKLCQLNKVRLAVLMFNPFTINS